MKASSAQCHFFQCRKSGKRRNAVVLQTTNECWFTQSICLPHYIIVIMYTKILVSTSGCSFLILLVLCRNECLGFDVLSQAASPGQITPPNPVWTSRRGMLATSAASLLPLLNWSSSNCPSWMADANIGYSKHDIDLLRDQAVQAAACVTKTNMDEYEQLGVTKVSKVISQEWINLLREGCDLAQDEAGPYAEYLNKPTDEGIFFTDLELARRLPLFAAFSLYSPVAAIAGTLMGSHTVRYLYDQLFVKEKGVSTATPWHQDGGYWRVKGEQLGSVFVPLDTVDSENGLQFVARSQKWSLYNPQHFADGTQYRGTSLPTMPDIHQLNEDSEVELLNFGLEPGDVLVFSAKTVHGGPGNWGRALSTRWVGEDGRFWDRPGEGAVPTVDVKLHEGQLLSANPKAFPATWHSS
jgi:ectoine hydroxylase-related dioxygenase (phytanoyl-CoA dioxygenase family)